MSTKIHHIQFLSVLFTAPFQIFIKVEDGRIGGNQEFDQEVRDQYEYEVEEIFL